MIGHSTSNFAKDVTGPVYRVSLYRYNAVLSYAEDEFQERETIQIITGLHSSVTAASVSALEIPGGRG